MISRLHLIPLVLFYTSLGFSQVEIPASKDKCSMVEKPTMTYCFNTSTYTINWMAMKISNVQIENRVALPSDADVFKGYKIPESTLWRRIENQVKLWAMEYDSVFVVTGFVTEEADSLKMPCFYKAVLKGCQGDAIGFLVKEPGLDELLKSYTFPIDQLEEITGIDFFPSLDVGLQQIIEESFNPDFWPLAY